MGRIIGYQYDNDIKDDDAWIGTEATSRRTKQYTAQAVADYLNINGSISIVGQMSYKYSTTPLNGIGTFAVFGGGPNTVAFSAITKLTLSNQDISEQRVVEYLDLLVGSDMIISESGQISTFGYYSIDGYVVNATNSDYYDLSVTFKSGNGAMEADKVYETQNFTLAAEENISTLQTTIDSGNTYQATPASALWTWSASAITVASTSFTSFLSGKRFKTTFIADGSYTDVLPNQLIFNNALGNETSITPNTALSSNIDLQWPSSSGTLALTTDITDSPWDTVSEGINYAGGNVGIGTTTPLAKLQVFGGSAIIGDDDFNAVKISANGSGTTYNTIGNGFIAPNVNFNINNQTKLTINGNSGNVGIGTTSPSQKLEVDGNAIVSGIGVGATTIYSNSINLNNSGTVRIGNAEFLSKSINDLSIYQGKIRIQQGGNVGIGTTNPNQKLQVSGNILATGNITAYGGASDSSVLSTLGTLQLRNSGNTNVNIQSTGNSYLNGGNVGIGTTSPSEKLHVNGNLELGPNPTLYWTSNTLNLQNKSIASIPVVNIKGNVNYGGRLQVEDELGLTTIRLRGDGNSYFNGGNVGIGTTSPVELLQVGNDSSSSNYIHIAKKDSSTAGIKISETTSGRIGFLRVTVGEDLELGTENSNEVSIFTNGVSRVHIDGSTGNVGIGTTSPNKKLHVNSGAINEAARFESTDVGAFIEFKDSSATGLPIIGGVGNNFDIRTGGSTSVRVTSAGNVGIGTDGPGAKLHIAGGNLRVDSDGTAADYSEITDRKFQVTRSGSSSGMEIETLGSYSGNGGYIDFNPKNLFAMRISGEGNVGIGTTSPNFKLDVNGNIAIASASGSTVSNQISMVGGRARFGYDGSINSAFMRSSDVSKPLVFGSGTSEFMRIVSSTGNIGIGTDSPTSKLDVAGGDIELDDVAAGIIMRSPDGTKYRITVANGGTLTVTAV